MVILVLSLSIYILVPLNIKLYHVASVIFVVLSDCAPKAKSICSTVVLYSIQVNLESFIKNSKVRLSIFDNDIKW